MFSQDVRVQGLAGVVPLNSPHRYETTKTFARAVAETLARRFPDAVVANMTKNLRAGKVLVDWSQNDAHKTTICAYSLRAKDHPTVSTPVTWEEVDAALRSKARQPLTFEAAEVLRRVKKHGDLFAPVLKLKQKLPLLNRRAM